MNNPTYTQAKHICRTGVHIRMSYAVAKSGDVICHQVTKRVWIKIESPLSSQVERITRPALWMQ